MSFLVTSVDKFAEQKNGDRILFAVSFRQITNAERAKVDELLTRLGFDPNPRFSEGMKIILVSHPSLKTAQEVTDVLESAGVTFAQ